MPENLKQFPVEIAITIAEAAGIQFASRGRVEAAEALNALRNDARPTIDICQQTEALLRDVTRQGHSPQDVLDAFWGYYMNLERRFHQDELSPAPAPSGMSLE